MNKPHKHAELIKLWADGAEIEYLETRLGWHCIWIGIQDPSWESDKRYRIKTTPKPDIVRYGIAGLWYGLAVADVKYLGPENLSAQNNLKLTFDGETGKLKSAEVINSPAQ